MEKLDKLNILRKKTEELLAEALETVRKNRTDTPQKMERRFRVAEYFLTEAKEYLTASWILLKEGKPSASLATSRWLVEASLDLIWVTSESDKIRERIDSLWAEAFRLEAALLDDLAIIFPEIKADLLVAAQSKRKSHKELNGNPPNLPGLKNRIDSIKELAQAGLKPYVLYRICCAASHPKLALHSRYVPGPGNSIATLGSLTQTETKTACYVAAASTLHLVSAAYCLTTLGNAHRLKKWWKNEIRPLLN